MEASVNGTRTKARDILFEDVLAAIGRISPVPRSMSERTDKINEALDQLCGQHTGFKDETGEPKYSPANRYFKFIDTGT